MNEEVQRVQIALDDIALPVLSLENGPPTQQEFSLPPADGGRDAWLMLAGCAVMEGLVWSFPFSFGVFQDYYSKSEDLIGDRSSITLIGTIAFGVLYIGSIFNLLLHRRWPEHRRKFIIGGLLLSSMSLVVAFSYKEQRSCPGTQKTSTAIWLGTNQSHLPGYQEIKEKRQYYNNFMTLVK